MYVWFLSDTPDSPLDTLACRLMDTHPRVGDSVRFSNGLRGDVTEIVWRMDVPAHDGHDRVDVHVKQSFRSYVRPEESK